MALTSDGTAWSWGCNTEGQLGDGGALEHAAPVALTNLRGVTAVSAGGWHSLALTIPGPVYCLDDAAQALQLAGGLLPATPENVRFLDVVTGDRPGEVDLADAVSIARRAFGFAANP